jgi:superfamily II DNA or RNA helicase
MFKTGSAVHNAKFGVGQVVIDDVRTVVVQFECGIERCLPAELSQVNTPLDTLQQPIWDRPLEVIARILGEAIQSVNDRWGVFSRSRIALLPHQLWVCRRVLEKWPTRWLVADDVGLGKTIEAGLILWPVISRGTVRRLLIVCPASLVEQWQLRMKNMFDIRLSRYVAEADTNTSDFWHTHPQIVASLQTLRTDSKERHKRMLEAPAWDLIVVDEAHHLNSDDKSGPTLGYRLMEKLVDGHRAASMVFFTGTPHRGKNFGFLSLLHLLRPDLFDPKHPLSQQLSGLSEVMIRNNKQNVTDLKGQRLFHPPKVTSQTYIYSNEETRFYEMLTEFIASGKAYASTLSSSDQRTVILVLISMQKLASSSIAAIRRALNRRLQKLQGAKVELSKLKAQSEVLSHYIQSEDDGDSDEVNRIEEQIAELVELNLLGDEEARLEELIVAANQVNTETKITEILGQISGPLKGRSVLFFTEYKATQSLLMSELKRNYGDDCVAFINGEGKAEGVKMSNGLVQTLLEERQAAAERFNSGCVQFLVSTEAAGEGIDLQKQCHTLIHVDLPWNPMRLHQRVGRLYRYGQTKQVEVFTLRNPSTVESRIWDKLNAKIEQIMLALGEAMDEPEDLLELVLGMTSSQVFRDIFSDAPDMPPESLTSWFDQKAATFGGRDMLDAVQDLVGHCASFDFQEMSERIPKVDLPALKPFFLAMLALNNRRAQESESGLTFKTPDDWLTLPAARTSYSDMVFSRDSAASNDSERVLGFGHVVFHEAIRQSRDFTASVTAVPSAILPGPILVFRVSEHVTSSTASVRNAIAAVECDGQDNLTLLSDWQLIDRLNALLKRRTFRRDPAVGQLQEKDAFAAKVNPAASMVKSNLGRLDIFYVVPDIQLLAIVCPSSTETLPDDLDHEHD